MLPMPLGSTCQAYGHTANSKECKFTTPFCGCCGLRHNTETAEMMNFTALTGYRSNGNRGKDILDFILANNLNIINKPDALPTFQRNNSVGWPDLTLCSQSLIDSSINWEVLEEISLSNHRYIETTIASTVANQFYKRYKTRHGNHLRFLNILERRKRPAASLLLSSYFTLTYNREGAGETHDLEADLSSGVHQQPERPTAWLQRRQVCGYSHQRATKQNSNRKKRWQACLSALY
ncbi:hypothetical protein AVEN_69170-1 [Araneus ventricosus]|uniref:Endonuclease/exonuclease/phosphatase domain-containing protein n=1 Tax=Araneus ventricosus TaxID=182803 RepID=A0A4Y2FUW7_ARAVE|nr:hypothetical protein AVEN_191395-1 [Araneus ventricosus]GBM45313.1 hypothetical protein AVEN_69170-1 [Araneus ventricosus]